MRRREFVTFVGGAAASWPLAARAQQRQRMRRIGVLMNLGADDAEGQARLAAFLQGLQEAGWIVGRNVRIQSTGMWRTRWRVIKRIRWVRSSPRDAVIRPCVMMSFTCIDATGSPY
jgi:hypothetical protein